MKTKPFNLEEALNGAKVVTRDGREVTQLTKFDVNEIFKLYGVVKSASVINTLHSFDCLGKFHPDVSESEYDLFIAVEPIKRYLNIYSDDTSVWVGIQTYKSETEAIEYGITFLTYIKTIEITNEP